MKLCPFEALVVPVLGVQKLRHKLGVTGFVDVSAWRWRTFSITVAALDSASELWASIGAAMTRKYCGDRNETSSAMRVRSATDRK